MAYEETVEEMINLFKESGEKLDPNSIATDVADNLHAHGVPEEEINSNFDSIVATVKYYLTPAELKNGHH